MLRADRSRLARVGVRSLVEELWRKRVFGGGGHGLQ